MELQQSHLSCSSCLGQKLGWLLHLGSDRDQFQGPVRFHIFCFVHAALIQEQISYLTVYFCLRMGKTEDNKAAVGCLPPFVIGVCVACIWGRRYSFSKGYYICSVVSFCLYLCVCSQCTCDCLYETQRCTFILLFTISFSFMYPLPCSARLPSHSPSSSTPSPAFTTINLES